MRRTRKPPPAVQEQLIGALLPDVHAEPPPHSPGPLPTLPTPTRSRYLLWALAACSATLDDNDNPTAAQFVAGGRAATTSGADLGRARSRTEVPGGTAAAS